MHFASARGAASRDRYPYFLPASSGVLHAMADAELALVNKVELKFILAEKDDKLQSLLKVYLAPLLLKLNSPHEKVRNKVVDTCKHINERLKSSTIALPVEALLTQFADPAIKGKGLMQSFDLMFVQKSKPNPNLLPLLAPCITEASTTGHAAAIWHIILRKLSVWTPPDRGTSAHSKLPEFFTFDKQPELERLMSAKFMELLIPHINSQTEGLADTSRTLSAKVFGSTPNPPISDIVSNNSSLDAKRVPSLKHDFKLAAVKCLTSGAFTPDNRYFPLLLASHQNSHEIADSAKMATKKVNIDLESPQTVSTLYAIALNVAHPKVFAYILKLCSTSVPALRRDPKTLIDYGLEAYAADPDCWVSIIEFVRSLLRKAADAFPSTYASVLVENISNWIKASGWPRLDADNYKLKGARAQSYELLGTIAHYVPQTATMDLFNFLFSALEDDSADMRHNVQDALSETLVVVGTLDEQLRTALKGKLIKYAIGPDYNQSLKYVAVRFAVRVAPFNDPAARVICILGTHESNRADVIEEAQRGLHPHWFNLLNSTVYESSPTSQYESPFPSFSSLYNALGDAQSEIASNFLASTLYDYSTAVFTSAASCLEKTLIMEASVQAKNRTLLVIDDNWESRIETAIEMDKDVRSAVKDYLAHGNVETFPNFLKGLLLAMNSRSGVPTVTSIWNRLLSLAPPTTVDSFITELDPIVAMLDSSKYYFRESAAKTLGIVATSDTIEDSKVSQLCEKLRSEIASGNSFSIDQTQGRILALGTIISRLSLRSRQVDVGSSIELIIDNLLSSTNSAIQDACCDALYNLALCGSLQSVNHDLSSVVEKLSLLSKKESEGAILAIGAISITAADEAESKKFVDKIIELSTGKHVELLFASGEALTIAACGWNSTVTDRLLDIQGVNLEFPSTHDIADYAMSKVIEACQSTKPTLRRFACIWLLSMIQYCGKNDAVLSHIEKAQLCFMKFLAERDDIVQDSASRGLGILYELGDGEIKQNLVQNLVQSFTSDSKNIRAGTVSEDTELFEPGVLNTGDGSSVTTYKDILNLATEVGDPSLVYKFMSLAAHSSLWASRRGAAFGLGGILSKANLDDVFSSNPRLSKPLIPKLYRYRFDPNQSVQQSMRGIWDALIKDKSGAVLDDHFDDILDELLKGMGDREWRVRQASSAALSDLLQGRLIEKYQQRLSEIWRMAFRVTDDIKDSVRTAGMQLTRGLASTMVRHVDVDSGASEKTANDILKELIPFLMGNNGLQSDAEEVQKFALDTVLKLSKKAGRAIKPYIPVLAEELLGLLSTLEPQAMNYLALNADKYGLTNDAIDASRMASLRSSPMMDAVEQMVEMLDDDLLKDFIPRLVRSAQKSVGLPSKLGASRIFVLLTIRRLHQATPYADTLLKAASSQITNPNDTVSQSFAMSAGYVCRMASTQTVSDYAAKLTKLYFDSDDERERLVSGSAVNSVAKHSSDKFDSVASAFLPLVFIGKHDPSEAVKERFEQTWSDNTGGSGAIKLYMKEISDLVSHHIKSQQWTIRQVCAKSIAEAANSVGKNDIGEEGAFKLLSILVESSSGRSWSGKELVLDALVSLAGKTKEVILKADRNMLETLNKTVVTEVKRKNKEYQVKAVTSYANYVHEFPQKALYETLFEVVEKYLNPAESDEDADGDVDMENQNKVGSDTAIVMLKALGQSYQPVDIDGNPIPASVLETSLKHLSDVLTNSPESASWKVKLAVLDGVNSITSALSEHKVEVSSDKAMASMWKSILTQASKDVSLEKVRIEAAKTGGAIAKAVKALHKPILDDLRGLKQWDVSTIVQSELDRVIGELSTL